MHRFFFQSPAHSYSSYDSGKNESVGGCGEDLSLNRGDEDEDDHDDHEDVEKATEVDGVEAERLKAFNVSDHCDKQACRTNVSTLLGSYCSYACGVEFLDFVPFLATGIR